MTLYFYEKQAYVAGIPEVLLIFDHLLQHGVSNVAQLESGRFLRNSDAVEYVRPVQET